MNLSPPFNTVDAETLTEARIQLHYAVQFIAVTGAALAEPLPDGSHTSSTWNSHLNTFVGPLIRTTVPFRVALDTLSLTVMLLDKQDEMLSSLPLAGRTMADGLTWLKQELAKLGADTEKLVFLSYPANDFPDHALAQGATFATHLNAALNELTAYYAHTNTLLQEIRATYAEASFIHIWPHHFDMATLITLPGMQNGFPFTIGVGLSPGDRSYNEPYWYVSPYPYPEAPQLPSLPGAGFWQTQPWFGAVLTASHLLSPVEDALPQIRAFLNASILGAIALLPANSSG